MADETIVSGDIHGSSEIEMLKVSLDFENMICTACEDMEGLTGLDGAFEKIGKDDLVLFQILILFRKSIQISRVTAICKEELIGYSIFLRLVSVVKIAYIIN
ncbi:MAG: hypothetical protein VZR26_05950, partial [Erysipelotrichaceae bacterium]|nr:hypothetical protein [Erysipelotrichaceae bacterium]